MQRGRRDFDMQKGMLRVVSGLTFCVPSETSLTGSVQRWERIGRRAGIRKDEVFVSSLRWSSCP